MEFGVASGSTLTHLATTIPLRHRTIYGFDSFHGLPEPWATYPAGHFRCDPPQLPDNCRLVVGLFADTLPAFLATHPGNAALIHIDCDLYESVRTVLRAMAPRIVRETVIVLDEYFIVTDHEQRAFTEWLRETGRSAHQECRSIEQLCVVMDWNE